MPEQRPATDAPGRAVEATIERIRETLLTDCDPDTLNEIRAAFRSKIPFRLRSYAAALLILEASTSPARGGRGEGRRKEARQRQEPNRQDQARQKQPREQRKRDQVEQAVASPLPSEDDRPRFEGEGTTLFFGMGKRQRLYPRVLLRILMENGGLAPESIGDIRSFDNYSFADIDPLRTEDLVAALEGFAFRGRALPVSKARKRGEPRIEDDERELHRTTQGDQEEIGSDAAGEYEGDEDFDDSSSLDGDFADQDEGSPDGFEEDDAEPKPAD